MFRRRFTALIAACGLPLGACADDPGVVTLSQAGDRDAGPESPGPRSAESADGRDDDEAARGDDVDDDDVSGDDSAAQDVATADDTVGDARSADDDVSDDDVSRPSPADDPTSSGGTAWSEVTPEPEGTAPVNTGGTSGAAGGAGRGAVAGTGGMGATGGAGGAVGSGGAPSLQPWSGPYPLPIPAESTSQMGRAVSVSGDSVLVGAHDLGTGLGVAYVFVRNGEWALQQALVASDGATDDDFALA